MVLEPTEARAWHGLRTLIEALPGLHGEGDLADLRSRHRHALAGVPGLSEHSEGFGAQRPLLAARTLSHLSHNFLLQRPFFEALADFVHAAAQDTGVTVLVPDLAILDRETVGLLRTLYRRFPETAPSLVVGFDPERPTPEPDSEGLIWELRNEEVWRVALGLRALPNATTHDFPRSPNAPQAASGPHGTFEPLETAEALCQVRTAFESFAFEAALRRGLAVLRGGASLTPRQRAEVHGLVALAAHNRQFRSLGNQRLAEFLCKHLTLALEHEDRAAERSALCYRLAVATGRRLKDREAGLAWSERAIEEAKKAAVPKAEAAILEAWGRNIKSFMLTGTGQLDDAAQECERAYRQLDRALEGEHQPLQSPRASVREVVYSRSILADNLGAIHQMAGNAEHSRRWKTVADGHNRKVPEVERYEAQFWIFTHRRQLQLDAARERARRGLEAARRDQDALREYRYGVELADLSYRLQDAAGALASFQQAEALTTRLGSPPFLRPTRLAAAAAASRAGRPGEALARIEAMLSEPSEDHPVARAPALALKGLCLARAGDGSGGDEAGDDEAGAEESLDEAIDLAVATGERDLMLLVAVSAGRCCQLLGNTEEARDAYLQALEIASAGEAGNAPPPALELAAHLGRLETSDRPVDSSVQRCLDLFTEALEDAETWWRLDRLETQLERADQDHPQVASVLDRLRGLLAQG